MRKAAAWRDEAGWAVLILVHLLFLRSIPGLHFDEAWAMNHSLRIMGGEFTLQGMSPYTGPWTHYVGAFFLFLLGPSLFVFRLSQVCLSLGGIYLLQRAMRAYGKEEGARWLPWMIVLLPGLWMNHRFAIELNTFHVFCFGACMLALVKERYFFLVVFWLLGVTSHILFYAMGLAFVGACLWQGVKLEKYAKYILFAFVVLVGFFLRVYLDIPEKGKALTLLASAFTMPLLLFVGYRPRWAQEGAWWWILGLAGIVFLANAFLFLPGFWQLAITKGTEEWRGVIFVLVIPLIAWLSFLGFRELPVMARASFILGVIFFGIMMIKAAPRYYELIMLSLAAMASVGISLPQMKKWRVFILTVLTASTLWYGARYFTLPAARAELRWMFLKDSSRDFLSKQKLAEVLGGWGCRLSDIRHVDSRVREALQALEPGDWPLQAGVCPRNLMIDEADPDFRIRGE